MHQHPQVSRWEEGGKFKLAGIILLHPVLSEKSLMDRGVEATTGHHQLLLDF